MKVELLPGQGDNVSAPLRTNVTRSPKKSQCDRQEVVGNGD